METMLRPEVEAHLAEEAASPEEPLVTTTSDSDTPIEPELVPDAATPAATAPVVPADDGPGWAPRWARSARVHASRSTLS